ncbi:hypothetical protein HDV00_012683, partial [Rhizophlyctis rosea]
MFGAGGGGEGGGIEGPKFGEWTIQNDTPAKPIREQEFTESRTSITRRNTIGTLRNGSSGPAPADAGLNGNDESVRVRNSVGIPIRESDGDDYRYRTGGMSGFSRITTGLASGSPSPSTSGISTPSKIPRAIVTNGRMGLSELGVDHTTNASSPKQYDHQTPPRVVPSLAQTAPVQTPRGLNGGIRMPKRTPQKVQKARGEGSFSFFAADGGQQGSFGEPFGAGSPIPPVEGAGVVEGAGLEFMEKRHQHSTPATTRVQPVPKLTPDHLFQPTYDTLTRSHLNALVSAIDHPYAVESSAGTPVKSGSGSRTPISPEQLAVIRGVFEKEGERVRSSLGGGRRGEGREEEKVNGFVPGVPIVEARLGGAGLRGGEQRRDVYHPSMEERYRYSERIEDRIQDREQVHSHSQAHQHQKEVDKFASYPSNIDFLDDVSSNPPRSGRTSVARTSPEQPRPAGEVRGRNDGLRSGEGSDRPMTSTTTRKMVLIRNRGGGGSAMLRKLGEGSGMWFNDLEGR